MQYVKWKQILNETRRKKKEGTQAVAELSRSLETPKYELTLLECQANCKRRVLTGTFNLMALNGRRALMVPLQLLPVPCECSMGYRWLRCTWRRYPNVSNVPIVSPW